MNTSKLDDCFLSFVRHFKTWEAIYQHWELYKANKEKLSPSSPSVTQNKPQISVKGEAPTAGWHCLNTDGPVQGLNGLARCAEVVRDEQERWVVNMQKSIVKTPALVAEL